MGQPDMGLNLLFYHQLNIVPDSAQGYFLLIFSFDFKLSEMGINFQTIHIPHSYKVYTLLYPPTLQTLTYPQWSKTHTKSIISISLHTTITHSHHSNTPSQNQQSFLFLIYGNTKMGIII